MAPERHIVAPGRAHAPRELPRSHQSDVGGWPLPARVVRQIQREVARAGRSLQRLEVRGAVIDNFDALGPPSPPSPRSPTPASCRTPDFFTSGEVYQDESMDTEKKVKREEDGQGEDNDLTSLTWLQDRNLLRSINFSKTENDELRPISAQSVKSEPSPTSDYQEESVTWEPADSSGSSPPPASPPHTPLTPTGISGTNGTNGYHPKANSAASKLKHPHNVAYNPLVHTQNKPPYSFSCLIFMAIEDSSHKALPVKEIYAWIVQHFPYFRSAPAGWKNSVRHNLSLNKCFQKVEKAPSLGKGSLWMVDDQYRSNLLQAFSRSPFHPCVPPAQPTPAPTPLDSSRLPSVTNIRGPKGAPNPQLFPFLSRRLAASEPPETPTSDALSGHDSCDSLDEVVVAAMVLALKHGPGVLPPSIVSSYANQDHTYSAATGRAASPEAGYASDEQRKTAEALLHLAGVHTTPQIQQAPHRPRLLRMPPKRCAPSPQHGGPPPQQGENNNQPGLLDHNLPRAPKRPRHHQHPSKHQHQ